uniref:Flap endonuclease 1 n=1 Tax=Tetraodon nigroviridis TaxID=99883 RepID=H3CB72_TETNG
MGIHGLAKLIADQAPGAIKEQDIRNYFGRHSRKIAIDASMCIYQFLIAVRQDGNVLQNEDGETTSHLMGMFYRTIRMLEHGIKPVYVFDGKPPQLKSSEVREVVSLLIRLQIISAICTLLSNNLLTTTYLSTMLVIILSAHLLNCSACLQIFDVAYIHKIAITCITCISIVLYISLRKDQFLYGQLLHMKKLPIQEFHFSRILQEIGLTNEQFIDLCILLGCDYCGTIKGIGPKRAIDLIKQHGCIEEILENIDSNKHPSPEDWLYKEARGLFLNPEVVDCSTVELKWSQPDEDGLIQFMCNEKQFSEDRIRNGCKKIVKSRQGSTQGRLDSFFTVTGSLSSKRKEAEGKGSAKKKQKTGATPGKFRKGK